MSTAPITKILAQMTKVRQRQPGQYSACCPAHDDKSPSLSVRETPDGAVLLYCFSGCPVSEVVNALGLEMSDLFPPRQVWCSAQRVVLAFEPLIGFPVHAFGLATVTIQDASLPA